MTKGWQVYYNTIFGAIGALMAWLVVGLIDTTSWNVHLANAFVGAGVGLFIGAALGVVEGLLVKRTLSSTVVGVLGGAVVGMISGLIGLVLGGAVFVAIEGGLIARVLGWMLFGAFLGVSQGWVNRRRKSVGYGLIGGTLAGLVGGLFYELFTQVFLEQSDQAQVFLSAIGLILIGISLGVIIPFSISVMGVLMAQRGIIVFQTGPRRGTEVELIGSATLGSSDACQVYIQDKRVEKKQGQIDKGPNGFEIRNIGVSQFFSVNRISISPGKSEILKNGTLIQMGDILMRFQVAR